MKIQCQGCSTKLEIPDERLPLGKRVILQCPKCGERISVIREDKTAQVEVSGETQQRVYLKGVEIPEYEEGNRYALVIVDSGELKGQLMKEITDLAYRPHFEDNLQIALEKLKAYKFDLLVLQEPVRGVSLISNPVMEYINQLNMIVRREMYLVAIGDGLKTSDPMLAYTMSVELVLNIKDLNRFSKLVSDGIKNKQSFYRAFLETMKELKKI
ncbi:MAG: zinc-ribbon domain-containing protein [Desulfatiglandales bacterium]